MKITISKTNGIWIAVFTETDKITSPSVFKKTMTTEQDIDSVESDSFSGLMMKIGEKNWIDQINKNP